MRKGMNTLARVRGLLGLGIRRVLGRVTGVEPQRVVLAILGVGFAVALLITVTGLALGLAMGPSFGSDAGTYWIVPERGGAAVHPVTVSGARLGDTHSTAAELTGDPRIRYTTPVLIQVIQVQNPETDDSEDVLAIGVVPSGEPMEIAGLPTSPLNSGDPYYSNGSYDGRWTGEVVLSEPAALFLNATNGTTLQADSGKPTPPLAVTSVAESTEAGFGQLPIMVMHLSELQTITGGTEADIADQIMVSTADPAVKSDLQDIYPGTVILSNGGLGPQRLADSGLPLAVAVAAFLTALGVGALFVATMMGLEITADGQNLAILGAIGYSSTSRSILVGIETILVSGLGGLVGGGFGIGGILLLNAGIAQYLGVPGVAIIHPLLPVYGFSLSVLMGLLAAPYPILRARNSTLLEVIAHGPR